MLHTFYQAPIGTITQTAWCNKCIIIKSTHNTRYAIRGNTSCILAISNLRTPIGHTDNTSAGAAVLFIDNLRIVDTVCHGTMVLTCDCAGVACIDFHFALYGKIFDHPIIFYNIK